MSGAIEPYLIVLSLLLVAFLCLPLFSSGTYDASDTLSDVGDDGNAGFDLGDSDVTPPEATTP
eukprot:5277695-Alexandrium_andersonii.AAC.1